MTLRIINRTYFLSLALAFFMLFFAQQSAFAAVHGMSPRDGHVTTSTGAPIPYITVTESTDTCMPIDYWSQWKPSCPYPYDPSLAGTSNPACHVERSVRTDQNGYYYFPPWWPGFHGGTSCDPNLGERYTCSNPVVKIGAVSTNPIALNLIQNLTKNVFASTVLPKVHAQGSDCTPVPHPTTNISDNITTDLVCNPPPQNPPACGAQCFRNDECAGAKDGCTICVGAVIGDSATGAPSTPGKCTAPPVPACGDGCSKNDDCAGNKNGCTACLPNSAGQNVCSQVPACGTACQKDDQCAGAKNGCTMCIGGSCQTPQACGTACTKNDECAGARDGCNVCSGGTCKAPACGLACTKDDDCAGAKDGCTTCGDNDAGTGKVCRPQAACGVACTKDTQCAGAKDGCTFCTAGKCSAFNPDMCSCDGIDFVAKSPGATFLPGDNVTFVAFGKVPGKDWKGSAAAAIAAAEVKSMQLSLYQSKASDPNNATRIAQSTAITPVVVEKTASKVRYKVTWDQKIPATPPPGTIYRVQATLKCGAKAGVLGATSVGQTNYFTQLFDSVAAMFAQGSVLAVTTGPTQRPQQQLESFNPQARILEKSCTIMRFTFD